MSPATEKTLHLYNIEQIIAKAPNDPLWQGTVSNPQAARLLGIVLGLIGIFILCILGIYENSDSWKDFFKYLLDPEFLIYGFLTPVLLLYFTIPLLDASASMKYQIYPSHIRLQWGIFNKKLVTIPFSAITAIHHVAYDNRKTSTLFFTTDKAFAVPMYNFKKNDLRPQMTFEDVHHGAAVCELLTFLFHYNQK